VKVSLIADVISSRGRSSTRHLLYQSANWDLDIFLCRDENGVEITGQVLPRTTSVPSALFDAVAVLVHNGTFFETTRISPAGEFEFTRVPEADLHLELFVNSTRMKVAFRP
jgi:hypothetical protein